MSNLAAWLVDVFSLLSRKIAAPPGAPSETPKFDAGFAIQPWTIVVASTPARVLACATDPPGRAEPTPGPVLNVPAPSLQALLTGDAVINPAVPTRLTNTKSVALDTCAAVVPVGSVEKSNCNS